MGGARARRRLVVLTAAVLAAWPGSGALPAAAGATEPDGPAALERPAPPAVPGSPMPLVEARGPEPVPMPLVEPREPGAVPMPQLEGGLLVGPDDLAPHRSR
jgi:hypothetical protein